MHGRCPHLYNCTQPSLRSAECDLESPLTVLFRPVQSGAHVGGRAAGSRRCSKLGGMGAHDLGYCSRTLSDCEVPQRASMSHHLIPQTTEPRRTYIMISVWNCGEAISHAGIKPAMEIILRLDSITLCCHSGPPDSAILTVAWSHASCCHKKNQIGHQTISTAVTDN